MPPVLGGVPAIVHPPDWPSDTERLIEITTVEAKGNVILLHDEVSNKGKTT